MIALHRLARCVVRRFDAFLRRQHGVWEFSQDQRCILRLGMGRCRRPVRLSDGTVLQPGDRLLELHLWNERIPPMPPDGPDLAWAARLAHRLGDSLDLLAAWLEGNPALADVRALHGVLAVPGGERRAAWERFLQHMGFDVALPDRTPWRAFADFWENLYAWALIWTFNPGSLRRRELLRMVRCHIWQPRGSSMAE